MSWVAGELKPFEVLEGGEVDDFFMSIVLIDFVGRGVARLC